MSNKFYEKFEKKTSPKEPKKNLKNFSSQKNNDKPHSRTSFNKNSLNKAESNHKDKYQSNSKNSFHNHETLNKYQEKYTKNQTLFTKNNLTKESVNIIQNFDEIVQSVRPLNSRQLQQLPEHIKELSHQLTDKRYERRLGYMNDNIQLSSYVRYYTWWNLVRLTRLFSNLPSDAFPQKDGICIDLGTGPFTVINALWLARPELRNLKLTWYCLDVSSNSMVFGEDLYLSIAARTPNTTPWNIIRVKGSFGTSIKQKADFITCANMFNELDQASNMPPEFQSKKYFEQLNIYGKHDCKYLLVEPGIPKATRTITLLRERFINAGKEIIAPCPHFNDCPMNGFKAYTGSQNKWCNFAFSTIDAPAKLLKLSEMAKLPKERATLIFISVSNKENEDKSSKKDSLLQCRIISDGFRLPENKTGYYVCTKYGLTLITTKENIHHETCTLLSSGDLIQVKTKTPDSHSPRDEKSGALIINL